MKKLLFFLDEYTYNFDNKNFKEKGDILCNMIAELYLPESEDKSWFWKFRNILERIYNILTEK